MECVLCIKRRVMICDDNGKPIKHVLRTECVGGEVKTAEINIFEEDNAIVICGFQDILEPFDNMITFNIVEKGEHTYTSVLRSGFGERIKQFKEEYNECYIESVELNGCKVFDINDCRGLLKCD